MSALNILMGIFFVGLLGGLFFLMRHFSRNLDLIGEARFDTRNKSDIDG
mgnify:CR=1 FL=1